MIVSASLKIWCACVQRTSNRLLRDAHVVDDAEASIAEIRQEAVTGVVQAARRKALQHVRDI
jgi:hypothetical protein